MGCKLLAFLLALCPLAAQAQQAGILMKTPPAPISVSTATTTVIITHTTGNTPAQGIYVTSWDVVVAGADNLTWEYGTGSTCGTGTQLLTGAYNFATNGGLTIGNGAGTIFWVPPTNDLCLVTSAGVQASGHVSYVQQ